MKQQTPSAILRELLATLRELSGNDESPTQHELGEMLGVAKRTFDRYLAGKKEHATPAQVVLKAQAMLEKARRQLEQRRSE